MPRRKKEAVTAEAETKPKSTTTKSTRKKKPIVRYVAKTAPLYHPFKNLMIPTGAPGVEIGDVDNWLEVQLQAGRVEKL